MDNDDEEATLILQKFGDAFFIYGQALLILEVVFLIKKYETDDVFCTTTSILTLQLFTLHSSLPKGPLLA